MPRLQYPPHTTHKLPGLDTVPFTALKKHWATERHRLELKASRSQRITSYSTSLRYTTTRSQSRMYTQLGVALASFRLTLRLSPRWRVPGAPGCRHIGRFFILSRTFQPSCSGSHPSCVQCPIHARYQHSPDPSISAKPLRHTSTSSFSFSLAPRPPKRVRRFLGRPCQTLLLRDEDPATSV